MEEVDLHTLKKEELINIILQYQRIFNSRTLLWNTYRRKYIGDIFSQQCNAYIQIDLTTGRTKSEDYDLFFR